MTQHFLAVCSSLVRQLLLYRGIFNTRNYHTWNEESPHITRAKHFQREFSINVWCGIVGDFLLGLYEIPSSRVTFIFLPTLLKDIPLNLRINLWFMHDGCPVHFERNVRNYLNNQFLQRWIRRGSDPIWPQRSPDLKPLDFFIWGHI